MSRVPHRIGLAFAAALLPLAALTASKPIPAADLHVQPELGYIMARIGPLADHGNRFVYFGRLDPDTHQAIWVYGTTKPSDRRELDAAIMSESDFIDHDANSETYIVPVHPGFWVIGGATNHTWGESQIAAGVTSFSMGSYGFTVRPGEVTDIGTILTAPQDGQSTVPQLAASRPSDDIVHHGTIRNVLMTNALLVRPATEADRIPAALQGARVTRAALVPDVRFNNFLRGLVNRALGLPPMEHQHLPAGGSAP
jgi:hypothetical protein